MTSKASRIPRCSICARARGSCFDVAVATGIPALWAPRTTSSIRGKSGGSRKIVRYSARYSSTSSFVISPSKPRSANDHQSGGPTYLRIAFAGGVVTPRLERTTLKQWITAGAESTRVPSTSKSTHVNCVSALNQLLLHRLRLNGGTRPRTLRNSRHFVVRSKQA